MREKDIVVQRNREARKWERWQRLPRTRGGGREEREQGGKETKYEEARIPAGERSSRKRA